MDAEHKALAMIGMGVFSVDPEGAIWRHMDGEAVVDPPKRADTGRHRAGSYLRLQFTWEGERLAVPAHRVVWMVANRRPIPPGLEINHRDGDKQNNRPGNLEIVTRALNVQHSFRVLGQQVKDQRGVKNTSAKLDEAKVLEIRAMCRMPGVTQNMIAERFGVTQRTVSEIHTRRTWQHVP